METQKQIEKEEKTNLENDRLLEIIGIAYKLKWITPNPKGYPLMSLSEVEKCMIAMINDFELNRMREWNKMETLNTEKQKCKQLLNENLKHYERHAIQTYLNSLERTE